MKRILVLLLAGLLLLAACQPTPDEEYVVNKKDSGVEAKLQGDTVENAASRGPQRLPEKWEEVYEAAEHMTFTFDAPILQKEDGLYPIYRTRSAPLSEAEMIQYLNVLFPDPVSLRGNLPTKDDYRADMQRYLEEAEAKLAWQDAGRPADGVDRDETPITREEVEEELKWFQEQINAAPETNQETPVQGYGALNNSGRSEVYRLKDGRSVVISSYNGNLYAGLGNRWCDVYYRYDYDFDKRHEEENPRPYQEVTFDKAKAEALALEALERLGIEGMVLVNTEEANLMDERSCTAAGYEMRFARDFGGYPYLGSNWEPSQLLTYGEDSGFLANAHIRSEALRLFADEESVKLISFSDVKMIVGIESQNAPLLPFEKVQERIRQGLIYGLTNWANQLHENEPDLKLNVDIYKIGLTTFTLHVPNSEDYYEMPCYVVYFDEWDRSEASREDKTRMQSTLVINALDGSIIHTDWGW